MNRPATLLLFIVLIGCINEVRAQTSEDSIRQTIDRLFTAMKNADSATLIGCFAPNAVLQSIVQKDGNTNVRIEPVQVFAASVAGMKTGDASEQVQYETIKMDDNLALVWGPYRFYWKGELQPLRHRFHPIGAHEGRMENCVCYRYQEK